MINERRQNSTGGRNGEGDAKESPAGKITPEGFGEIDVLLAALAWENHLKRVSNGQAEKNSKIDLLEELRESTLRPLSDTSHIKNSLLEREGASRSAEELRKYLSGRMSGVHGSRLVQRKLPELLQGFLRRGKEQSRQKTSKQLDVEMKNISKDISTRIKKLNERMPRLEKEHHLSAIFQNILIRVVEEETVPDIGEEELVKKYTEAIAELEKLQDVIKEFERL